MGAEPSGLPQRLRRTCAALLMLCVALAAMAAVDTRRANQVKAAYLINFLRYTDWPAASFPKPDSPFVITVAGGDDLVEAIRALAAAAGRINNRAIEVRRVQLGGPSSSASGSVLRAQVAEQLRTSHLFYLDRGEPDRAAELLDLVRDFPVLTVSDLDRFALSGGMLELLPRGPNIVLAANPVAIRRSELVVSAKVLKLARLVGEEAR